MPEQANTQAPSSVSELMISFDQAVSILLQKLGTWVEYAVANIPNLIVAFIAVFIAYACSILAHRITHRLFLKTIQSGSIAQLFATLIKVFVIAIGVFFALDFVGLKKAVVSLLAGAGIIGLAIGFAFQDLAENFLAGMMLAIRKPFKPGDVIETNSHMGTVHEMNLRNTILEDFDGQLIYIPNKDVFKTVLENYSKTGKRRISIQVGVSYGEDLKHVEKVIKDSIQQLDFLADGKDVDAWALEYGDSSINFSVRYWIDYPNESIGYLKAIHDGVKAIKVAFDEEDILIPFPIRTLDFGIKGGQNLATPMKEALTLKREEA